MNPKNPSYSFRKAWSWPRDIERKIAELIEGTSLHVCSGASSLGDLRIDLGKVENGKRTFSNSVPPDVVASMFNLPIRPASFDTVICDPPWELPYHKRHKLLYELRDTLKPGGRLIFNCFWFPKIRGLSVDREIFVGVPHSTWRNASLLITARRMALA